MKRRNREINIFSMSALDLFASALGAFILISVILVPFLTNSSSPEKNPELLVVMSWNSTDDVDLRVIAQENTFSFMERRHQGSDTQFEENTIQGPGNEIWRHPNPSATEGPYRIQYHLFRQKLPREPVYVRGAILTPNGCQRISPVYLDSEGQSLPIATITVDEEGNITVDEESNIAVNKKGHTPSLC